MKLTLPALILFATACFACVGVAASASGLLVTTQQDMTDLVILKLDWDEQRQLAHGFGARRQSTLVVFRGADEVGRAIAITSDDAIQSLLSQAYSN